MPIRDLPPIEWSDTVPSLLEPTHQPAGIQQLPTPLVREYPGSSALAQELLIKYWPELQDKTPKEPVA